MPPAFAQPFKQVLAKAGGVKRPRGRPKSDYAKVRQPEHVRLGKAKSRAEKAKTPPVNPTGRREESLMKFSQYNKSTAPPLACVSFTLPHALFLRVLLLVIGLLCDFARGYRVGGLFYGCFTLQFIRFGRNGMWRM